MLCSRLFCAPPHSRKSPILISSSQKQTAWRGSGSGRALNQSTPKLARRSSASDDRRNALYAEVSQLRGKLPTLPVPEVSERLSAYLDDPVVENDERLRLRVLIIKGETDEDLDPSLSQRSWTEALALAQKLGEAGWANRARGELGLVAFLQGDTNTAIVNLGQAIKVAETSGDTSSLVRWLTLFGHGFVELGRPEQAFDFYERALKVARTVPELQMPFMTLVGKADALVKVGRVSEAEELVTTTLAEAAKEGALGYQAELTLRLASIAIARKQTAQALEAMSRAAEFARAAGGNRILAGIALERARILRAANRSTEAESALREGITASRSMGERLLLPKLLAQLADLQLSAWPPRSSLRTVYRKRMISSKGFSRTRAAHGFEDAYSRAWTKLCPRGFALKASVMAETPQRSSRFWSARGHVRSWTCCIHVH